jgi:hypothetical protein
MLSFRPGIWDGDPVLLTRPRVTWLWQNYLARGKITLLTSLWKSGKTTLVSLLLSRRHSGAALAGLSVLSGTSAVISEEDHDLWAERRRRLDFGGRVCLFCQPFDRRPSFEQWLELLDHLAGLHDSHGLDLVVVDTIASFLPTRCENNAVLVQEALQPLRRLTRLGMGVLLLHHPRKGEPALGQAARGSGALAGFPDICIEMGHPGGDPLTRRRHLHALSRFAQTQRNLVIELNDDMSDYLAVDAGAADDFRTNWNSVLMVLEDAHHPLTRREILADWPPDFPRPGDSTLWSWLSRAVEQGLLCSEGTGRKSDPFRYWLAANEAKWQHDLKYLFYQNDRWLKKELAKADAKALQPEEEQDEDEDYDQEED